MLFEDEFSFTSDDYQYIRPSVESNSVGEFSLGVIFNNNTPVSLEFEIMPFSMHNSAFYEDIGGNDTHIWLYTKVKQTAMNSRLRYQMNYVFEQTKKIVFYIGLSSMLSYYYQKDAAYTTNGYTKKYNQIGMILGLTPGFKVPISEKLNFTFDIPVGILGLNYKHMNNPSLVINESEQQQGIFTADLWYQGFQVRAGIGFSL